MRKKYIRENKTIITPRENSKYFNIENVTYRRAMTPFEKRWAEYQQDKRKAKRQSKYPTVIRLLVLMFILATLTYVYIELASSFPETFNLIPL